MLLRAVSVSKCWWAILHEEADCFFLLPCWNGLTHCFLCNRAMGVFRCYCLFGFDDWFLWLASASLDVCWPEYGVSYCTWGIFVLLCPISIHSEPDFVCFPSFFIIGTTYDRQPFFFILFYCGHKIFIPANVTWGRHPKSCWRGSHEK